MTGPSASPGHGELAVGWVLHTLEPDEEITFLAHLPECDECARTVAETSEVVDLVTRAVPQEEPPPRLRSRLLDAIADEAVEPPSPEPLSSGPHPIRTGSTGPPVPGGLPERPDATVLPLRGRTRRRLLGLAAAAAVAVLVGGLVVANQSLRAERDERTVAASRSEQSEQAAARVVDVVRDAGAPGAVHATLAEPGGKLVGLVVDTGDGPQVLTTGLPANRPDQMYVLWGLVDARPVALGGFDRSGSAPDVRSVPSTVEAGDYGAYAVSLEPGRVLPSSPTEIVASGQVGR